MIDCHIHLWDLAARPVPWLDGDQPWASEEELRPLRRSFTPADFAELAEPAGVTGAIVVQAFDDPGETADLLAIAAAGGLAKAVVGWADLAAPDVAGQLAAYGDLPGGDLLTGIRHPLIAEADPDWLARPAVRSGLRTLGEAGLSFGLTVFEGQLAGAVACVRDVPGCVFTLDHMGGPPAERGTDSGWAEGVAELGRCENVVCKLSGAHTSPVSAATLAPYFDALLAAFGPSRLMIGSDWPVSSLTATYPEMLGMYSELIAALSPAEQDAIRTGTAQRVYHHGWP
ncbi:MAG TPA: amidohydrolase family protein, partial [Trebonia sp.]|nr:amidohydrolase family protein [Trebonia sp.]